ncbi:MAG TPA: SDR family oxidoreductase [Desulfurivibrionaceae bacterium]|nr:SDR family oxidoreductase [Desulfurivibrionaceae bacterium]
MAKTQRLALVTGGNKGLGFETCRQLARLGITVLLTARDRRRGEAATAELMAEGLPVHFVALDVTNSGQIHNVRHHLENHYGHLDILVNNAGTISPEEPLFGNSAATVSPDVLRRTFDVNFFGLVELTQALLPLLTKSPAGRIVNVSSILGSLTVHSDPDSDFASAKPFAYDASKCAVNQFTVHLAAALADTPIKVNAAHPGWVRTDLGGDKAPMEASEGAKTAVRLATLGPDGPTGGFFHGKDPLPW